ncbi:hypothetical protein B0H13DRAFT_2280701 [Mycena leptocephala]|nr:hypothetical protein B0H13DRAFT_2280701 [Mycena leptocephala]
MLSSPDFYVHALLPKKQGYPLFRPGPCDDLPETARRTGTEIGDVGVITSDGSFDVIFNIIRSPNDAANRFGVPPDFEQVFLPPGDIQRQGCHFPGAVVSNDTTVNKRSHSWATGRAPKQTGFLALPDGASSLDARSQEVFRDYALKHASNWYAFVNGDLQRMLGKDELYLVTGVTKSTSWRIGIRYDSSNDAKVSLEHKNDGSSWADASWARETANSSINSGPYRRPGEASWKNDQTIFLRGFKVALRSLMPPSPVGADEEDWVENGSHNIFHPSDVINQHILDLFATAAVAVTHDDEWISVLNEAESEFPGNAELISRISANFTVDVDSGSACLRRRASPIVNIPEK